MVFSNPFYLSTLAKLKHMHKNKAYIKSKSLYYIKQNFISSNISLLIHVLLSWDLCGHFQPFKSY